MKELAAPPPEPTAPPVPLSMNLQFPAGIVGFADYHRGELFHLPDQLPFQWLRLHGPTLVHFVVIDPTGLVPGYAPTLFADDAAAIGASQEDDMLLLTIVTMRGEDLRAATVNLVGPVIVHRHTGLARQVVIANHGRYCARHPLVTTG